MKRFFQIAVCVGALRVGLWAQDPAVQKPAGAKETTVIGCISGPDVDDRYTLSSMQHRSGLEVTGGDELKSAAGSKVKLTGVWESLPTANGAKKNDAARRFRASQVEVLADKCQAPVPTTPLSKKKQAQQKPQ